MFLRFSLVFSKRTRRRRPGNFPKICTNFPKKYALCLIRSLGTTPISGKTLSEWKGHSRSSRRVPGYSRSSSRNSKIHSRNTKFHSRNGSPRLEKYENQNSRSNSRSDSRNWWESTWKIFICPSILGAFFRELGWSPRARFKECCYEIFEQFSDLWLTPLTGGWQWY